MPPASTPRLSSFWARRETAFEFKPPILGRLSVRDVVGDDENAAGAVREIHGAFADFVVSQRAVLLAVDDLVIEQFTVPAGGRDSARCPRARRC